MPELINRGFRSLVLETDRAAALTLNDFVHHGRGTLDQAMEHGFSHGLGALVANRRCIAWLHDFNQSRPEAERVTVHGFDAPTEFTSAPSPRRFLLPACNYLEADIDIDELVGDDEQWSDPRAVMDAHSSPGATSAAITLRAITHDLLVSLYARAPELIASTSLRAWHTARIHLVTALNLLAYHRQAAQRIDEVARVNGLLATRDAIMAQNLIDIRAEEAGRGATLVFAHNRHLQRRHSQWTLGGMNLNWSSAGAIIDSVIGGHYTFVAGSLGSSSCLGLQPPPQDTYEGLLGKAVSSWGLVSPPPPIDGGRPRVDVTPDQGYFPLDDAVIQSADTILHVSDAATVPSES